jgi:hypothetical protein
MSVLFKAIIIISSTISSCFHHDIAEKLLIRLLTVITHSLTISFFHQRYVNNPFMFTIATIFLFILWWSVKTIWLVVCLVRNQQLPILMFFVYPKQGSKPLSTTLEESILTITLLMQLQKKNGYNRLFTYLW